MQLEAFLDESDVSEPFRQAVQRFLHDGRPNERVHFDARCPVIKVQRALTQALKTHADLPIESVSIDAVSGCEFFRGMLHIQAGEEERRIRFHWDCRWRAEREGWTDFFGLPDQARAARVFGYDCFRTWTEEPLLEAASS